MPDYTDPWLIPFPTPQEFADGSNQIEVMARAIDPLLVAQDARITALDTRPTLIARRSADVAFVPGDPIVFNTVDHNNASIVITSDGFRDNYVTPQPGAHAVAGVYPAIWRFDLNIYFTAGVPVAGDTYSARVDVEAYDPARGGQGVLRSFQTQEFEANAGVVAGSYLVCSGCVMLPSPGTFIPILGGVVVNGTFKANSFFSMTRIRSV